MVKLIFQIQKVYMTKSNRHVITNVGDW